MGSDQTGTPSKSTPLIHEHEAAGARIVDFAGFRMPLQYSGIVDEHHAVRKSAGLFDVSHMGQIEFKGPDAVAAVDHLMTNAVCNLVDNQVLYTPICYTDAGIVDDCLVYRVNSEHVLVVVNASNIDKDYKWFCDNLRGNCTAKNISDDWALIALQGPQAVAIWSKIVGTSAANIGSFTFCDYKAGDIAGLASRTGYTGEDGFEIFCRPKDAPQLWKRIMQVGSEIAPDGIKPCGLGARDTLRLEAKLPLYGNDIDQTTTPLEAGLGWTVKLKGRNFIGADVLRKQKADGVGRKLVCMVMRSKGIARHGYPVHIASGTDQAGAIIGTVTSGTMSPTLNQAIAMAYVPTSHAEIGQRVLIDARGKMVEAEVIKGPFYQRPNN